MTIKLLLGGSPCTYWSIAKTKGREVVAEGQGWELFKNYLIAKENFKPDFFLYENNWSAAKAIKDQIQEELGCELMRINSSLVSAQKRDRFYVFNWDVEQPKDRGIVLADILEGEHPADLTGQNKFYCLTASYTGACPWNTIERKQRTMVADPVRVGTLIPLNTTNDGKAQCVRATCYKDGIRNLVGNNVDKRTCVAIPHEKDNGNTIYKVENGQIDIKGKKYPINLDDGFYTIRKLTPVECERLQTLPDGYTDCVSNTQRYKGLGNGWTAEVIIHILQGALKDVPRDEKIVVLSMYDGIGTGRYCLDKMGFTNVEYHAFEIDKFAIKVANHNYPDIIQHGDAFQIREWSVNDEETGNSRNVDCNPNCFGSLWGCKR